MKISFFDPLPNFMFTPIEFSHSHRYFIHTGVTVVSHNVFHMMISLIEFTHRIHMPNPHTEFSHRVLICRFRGSQCGLIGARGERGLGLSAVRGRCCRVFGRRSSGGARRRRLRRKAACMRDGGGSICGGGGGGGSGGFGVGGGGSGGFGVGGAASASAASASVSAAARARRRGSACGRGCVGSALSSTIGGCDQAFVARACKQAA